MQVGRFRSSHEARVRDGRKGSGGQGPNGGHGGGFDNGNGRGGGGGGGGGGVGGGGVGGGGVGGGFGNANGGGDDNTSIIVTSTPSEDTTPAVTATTTTSASTGETSAHDKTTGTTFTAGAPSSDSSALTAVEATTPTAQATSTASAGSEETGASTSPESGSALSHTTSADFISTTAAPLSSGTPSNAISALPATSSASRPSSSSSSSSSKSTSSSHAGLIAGVIVGLVALIAIGFILYRFRRTQPMQRILAPFRKGTEQPRPYQNMEKPDVGMAPDMTGETLVGINTMRNKEPTSSLPKNNVPARKAGTGIHLTVDTKYLGLASARSVSPVSPNSNLAPEVSPVSSVSTRSNDHPFQQTSISNLPGPHRVINMAGSEARIVSIPPRSSRTLTGATAPRSSAGGRPGSPSTVLMSKDSPASNRNLIGAGGSGGAWRPPQQRTPGTAEFRPPALSINQGRQAPYQNAPRPAVDVDNAGYRPYHPSIATPPSRVSQGSMSDASIASSDVFSLTDEISWPKPPRTPTASPDSRSVSRLG